VGRIVVEPSKLREDTIDSLLDRIGILREQLISIERSLERMKNSQPKTPAPSRSAAKSLDFLSNRSIQDTANLAPNLDNSSAQA